MLNQSNWQGCSLVTMYHGINVLHTPCILMRHPFGAECWNSSRSIWTFHILHMFAWELLVPIRPPFYSLPKLPSCGIPCQYACEDRRIPHSPQTWTRNAEIAASFPDADGQDKTQLFQSKAKSLIERHPSCTMSLEVVRVLPQLCPNRACRPCNRAHSH